ncbi:MAG TPA: hypothetical protein VHW44_08650 [Pseudonocardiaceae bacterium]|jgi:hypothetical protein|nr:hypothetical protein [Pseudonocardiaceae bacterium]
MTRTVTNRTVVSVLLGTLGALLALSTLTGCGSPANTSSAGGGPTVSIEPTTPGGSTAPSAPATPTTSVAPGAISALAHILLPASQVDASSATGRAPTQVQVAGGTYLLFDVEQAGCELVSAQATDQTATQVVVTVTTTVTKKGNQMCPMLVRNVQQIVELSAPLGSRTVVFHSQTTHG